METPEAPDLPRTITKPDIPPITEPDLPRYIIEFEDMAPVGLVLAPDGPELKSVRRVLLSMVWKLILQAARRVSPN